MLFTSVPYIFVFLPAVLLGYFVLNKHHRYRTAIAWLITASLFFYGFWNPGYIPLILLSMGFNYGIATALNHKSRFRREILSFGIFSNIFFLGYYKYFPFILDNLNRFAGIDLHIETTLFPLAISYFTFQQIAFLVDTYRREISQFDILEYCLSICFFPKLIAGPIVNCAELMPHFTDRHHRQIRYENISMGLFLFSIGLFKKTVIADFLAVFADHGFDLSPPVDFYAAWLTSLSYTFQLYFDFSGYTDMALGSARMLNISLPANFNAPYKALSIQDFWRRWHITLSRFLQKYLYIPLGGNRNGDTRTYVNLFLTFLIGGIWHGAGWTFLVWGALHGAGIVAHRMWQKVRLTLPPWLAWLSTFLFVNFCWVFFRANSFSDAFKVIQGMLDFRSASLQGLIIFLADQSGFLSEFGFRLPISGIALGINTATLTVVILCFIVAGWGKNSNEIIAGYQPSSANAIYAGMLLFGGLLTFLSETPSNFIYFQF